MRGFHDNIEELTLKNTAFREVLYTGEHSQLVLMCLAPKQDIGSEVHGDTDQFFRFEAGVGKVVIDDNEYAVEDGTAIVVPAGATHNIINTSETDDLKLYTIYSPPHHEDGVVHETKDEAKQDDEEFDGDTTE